MIRIVIEGDVIPAARPRFSNRRCYQPKRNQEYRQKVQTAARLAMKGAEPLTDEICAAVKIYRKYKRSSRIFGDVDNHLKSVMDNAKWRCLCGRQPNLPLRRRKVSRQGAAASGD